ncbi:uncharacterized protein CIMG_13724 [Coccidioides immitis RS]|uniref:Uncharacterized protein n=1 Tax=Coccidioides immitis (strain RS) TaxID=246410 RepID=A0A0D8JX68_COCIM|nr:uncharacterized protein CIMG_13724 [Coccidioides immitis RS]KJF61531.1 hypothetical protein CIMG_13724 [Coccidioides immitis RS]
MQPHSTRPAILPPSDTRFGEPKASKFPMHMPKFQQSLWKFAASEKPWLSLFSAKPTSFLGSKPETSYLDGRKTAVQAVGERSYRDPKQ